MTTIEPGMLVKRRLCAFDAFLFGAPLYVTTDRDGTTAGELEEGDLALVLALGSFVTGEPMALLLTNRNEIGWTLLDRVTRTLDENA